MVQKKGSPRRLSRIKKEETEEKRKLFLEKLSESENQEGAKEEKKEESPSFGEDLMEIGTSFGKAVMDAGSNVVSTFGVATLAVEEDEKTKSWRGMLYKQFSPLSALAFMEIGRASCRERV